MTKITIPAADVNTISISTIDNTVRFLNKMDSIDDGQMTYSNYLKPLLKQMVPTAKFGIKNAKDSGNINKKIYVNCKHKQGKLIIWIPYFFEFNIISIL